MYHAWLDQVDERRAAESDADKSVTQAEVATDLAFGAEAGQGDLDAFCTLARQALEDHAFFDPPMAEKVVAEQRGNLIGFPSEMTTETEPNNTVWARITESRTRGRALVIFHPWNAEARLGGIVKLFARLGITVVEIALPYHLERARPGALHADYMVSANLGRTIRSMRQGVWDGRKLIRWLSQEGYDDISVLGISLGSWIASLVAAYDEKVTRAALFLSAGSVADVVWTGRATRLIRESLLPDIDLPSLREAWCPLDLSNHAIALARPGLQLSFVTATRDTVVLPEHTAVFIEALRTAGARPAVTELNCGHYTLSKPPQSFWAGASLWTLLQSKQT